MTDAQKMAYTQAAEELVSNSYVQEGHVLENGDDDWLSITPVGGKAARIARDGQSGAWVRCDVWIPAELADEY